jgi:hypothetical protein
MPGGESRANCTIGWTTPKLCRNRFGLPTAARVQPEKNQAEKTKLEFAERVFLAPVKLTLSNCFLANFEKRQ